MDNQQAMKKCYDKLVEIGVWSPEEMEFNNNLNRWFKKNRVESRMSKETIEMYDLLTNCKSIIFGNFDEFRSIVAPDFITSVFKTYYPKRQQKKIYVPIKEYAGDLCAADKAAICYNRCKDAGIWDDDYHEFMTKTRAWLKGNDPFETQDAMDLFQCLLQCKMLLLNNFDLFKKVTKEHEKYRQKSRRR